MYPSLFPAAAPLDLSEGSVRAGHASLDWSRWPVLCATPPPTSMTARDVEVFADTHGTLMRALSPPHALVVDLSQLQRVSAEHRQAMVRAATGTPDGRPSAVAWVASGSVTRRLLSASLWLVRMGPPCRVFAELQPALDWALARANSAR